VVFPLYNSPPARKVLIDLVPLRSKFYTYFAVGLQIVHIGKT